MSDSLGYVDKCMIASLAAMNASFLSREGNVRPASNAAIDTMKIKTLAEYYKGDPEKLKTYDPSKLDDKKLMRTYVIPLVLDNGETIDLIVNSNGQDMACVFLDADSKEHQFALTPRMKNEIMKNGIDGIETKLNISEIEKMIEPQTLEEFTEAVSKDELVPDSPRDTIAKVKEKNPDAEIQMKDDDKVFEVEDKENKTEEEIQEEISLEEERLKQIAEKTGMSIEELKRFCVDNKLTSKSIKGAIEVVNVEQLENLLGGVQLSHNNSGSVVIIKTEENNMQERARIISKDGETLLDNSKYDDRMVGLVPEHQTAEPIRNLEEYEEETKPQSEIEYTDSNGVKQTSDVQGNDVNSKLFEERINELMAKYKAALEELNNSDLSATDKSRAKEYMSADFYANVRALERETGVEATSIAETALAEAEQAVSERQKTEFVEGLKTTGKNLGKVIGVLVGADALMKVAQNSEERVRLSRDQEAMQKRGFIL